jgi:hypothetical protein
VLVQEALSKKGVKKFVGSSGGNAGVAMAVAAKGGQGTQHFYIYENEVLFGSAESAAADFSQAPLKISYFSLMMVLLSVHAVVK